MRQAARRSWRIGQTRPVKVVFMPYRNALQADALKLVAKKLQSSLAVEGELPEDGLAAYGGDGDGQMLALARDTEANSEHLPVDYGWKLVEGEPEAAKLNGSGPAAVPVKAMVITAKPQGRSQNPRPASASLSEVSTQRRRGARD